VIERHRDKALTGLELNGAAERAMLRHGQARLLMALFIGVVLLLGYPAVAVIETVQQAIGAPVLFLYVFGVWALAIGCAALILERPRS
jgi:hypothetical protein